MSIVTPFGQLSYGSEKGLPQWISAHDTQHRTYNQALALLGIGLGNFPMQTKEVTKDWLARNLFNHMSLHVAINQADPNPDTRLADTDWGTEQKFYDWHQAHNDSHAFIDQALGINGNAF